MMTPETSDEERSERPQGEGRGTPLKGVSPTPDAIGAALRSLGFIAQPQRIGHAGFAANEARRLRVLPRPAPRSNSNPDSSLG
jgi:hypothetical protein